jgi:hypothetical protein
MTYDELSAISAAPPDLTAKWCAADADSDISGAPATTRRGEGQPPVGFLNGGCAGLIVTRLRRPP